MHDARRRNCGAFQCLHLLFGQFDHYFLLSFILSNQVSRRRFLGPMTAMPHSSILTHTTFVYPRRPPGK